MLKAVRDYSSLNVRVLTRSPLAVEDFGSWRQVQTLTREGLGRIRHAITCLADAEGLTAYQLDEADTDDDTIATPITARWRASWQKTSPCCAWKLSITQTPNARQQRSSPR